MIGAPSAACYSQSSSIGSAPHRLCTIKLYHPPKDALVRSFTILVTNTLLSAAKS
jgi:Na+/alanine symporter